MFRGLGVLDFLFRVQGVWMFGLASRGLGFKVFILGLGFRGFGFRV